MSETEEHFAKRIKETGTLRTRLAECSRRIGKMCSEGRPPRMSIPAHWDDDDVYITQTVEEAGAEIVRLTKWVEEMQRGKSVHCAFCGHVYGPDPGTPTSQADVLTAHIETCEHHPMSVLKRRNAELEAKLERVRESLQKGSSN